MLLLPFYRMLEIKYENLNQIDEHEIDRFVEISLSKNKIYDIKNDEYLIFFINDLPVSVKKQTKQCILPAVPLKSEILKV